MSRAKLQDLFGDSWRQYEYQQLQEALDIIIDDCQKTINRLTADLLERKNRMDELSGIKKTVKKMEEENG